MTSLSSALRTTAAKATPNQYSQNWRGLAPFRKRRIRHVARYNNDIKLQSLTAAISSALQCPEQGLQFSSAIARSANIPYPSSLHATIIEHVININKNVSSNDQADLAIETFIRLSSNTRTTPIALLTVCEICSYDEIVERRAQRAASILRFTQHNRTLATYNVYKSIFNTFISAFDFHSALSILNYVHAIFTHLSIIEKAYWYDRLMYAALVRRELDVVEAANQTKSTLLLPSDSTFARNIHIALCAERGQLGKSLYLLEQLQDEQEQIEWFTFAFLIRAAGKNYDVDTILEFYQNFLQSIHGNLDQYKQSLSVLSIQQHNQQKQQKDKKGKNLPSTTSATQFSRRTTDEANIDPTYAVFVALRLCAQPERAVKLIRDLHNQFDIVFSSLLYSIISETCFRSSRVDLAVQLRKLVHKQYDNLKSKHRNIEKKSLMTINRSNSQKQQLEQSK